jgi:hypothetical protein
MTALAAELALEKTPLERYVAPEKPSLVGLSRAELAAALAVIGVPERERRMRAQQLWHWMYVRGATDFGAMTSVSKILQAKLAEHYTLARPEVVAEQISVDGTRKWLLQLASEHAGEEPHQVECVYIPEADRGTLCVSSQVGCTLNCPFCHTGTQRLVRNLTAGEIVGQVMIARDRLGDFLGASRFSPLAGRGRREAPGEGAFPHDVSVGRAPHPDPLPVNGERECRHRACGRLNASGRRRAGCAGRCPPAPCAARWRGPAGSRHSRPAGAC